MNISSMIYSYYGNTRLVEYAKSERFCNWKIEVKLTHLKKNIYIYSLIRFCSSLFSQSSITWNTTVIEPEIVSKLYSLILVRRPSVPWWHPTLTYLSMDIHMIRGTLRVGSWVGRPTDAQRRPTDHEVSWPKNQVLCSSGSTLVEV
jgi:hypothetical protein